MLENQDRLRPLVSSIHPDVSMITETEAVQSRNSWCFFEYLHHAKKTGAVFMCSYLGRPKDSSASKIDKGCFTVMGELVVI